MRQMFLCDGQRRKWQKHPVPKSLVVTHPRTRSQGILGNSTSVCMAKKTRKGTELPNKTAANSSICQVLLVLQNLCNSATSDKSSSSTGWGVHTATILIPPLIIIFMMQTLSGVLTQPFTQPNSLQM